MPAAVCPLSRYDPLTSAATSTGPDLADSESMPLDVTPPQVQPTGCQIPKCPGTGPAIGAVASPSVPGRVHCWGLGTQRGLSTTPSHKSQWDSLPLHVGSLSPWASAPCCPAVHAVLRVRKGAHGCAPGEPDPQPLRQRPPAMLLPTGHLPSLT